MIGIVGLFSLYFFLCNRGVLQGDTVSFGFFAFFACLVLMLTCQKIKYTY